MMAVSLDALREDLARALGPWLVGTVTGNVGRKTLVDSALVALDLEDDAWAGGFVRVDSPSFGWEERRITQYTAGTPGFMVHPELNATPSAGTLYEVHLPYSAEVLEWGINRAIWDARPEVYQGAVADWLWSGADHSVELPKGVDEVVGIELASPLAGERYAPIPAEFYMIQERQANYAEATAWWEWPMGLNPGDLSYESSSKLVTFRNAMVAGRRLRVHYKAYYEVLTSGTAETLLDREYVLWKAEAHVRRHLVGRLKGTGIEHHKEMMVHAEELAQARKAILAAQLAGVAVDVVTGKRKKR